MVKVEQKWPSLDLAYSFVKSSYDSLQNRLDAVNARIEFLLTLSVSINIAIPIFMKALFDDIYFGSYWLVAVTVVFVFTVIIGLIGRMLSGMILVSPQKLYDQWCGWSEWKFKKHAVYWAGKHFQHNASLIRKKANLGIVVTVLLAVEVGLIFLWIAGQL